MLVDVIVEVGALAAAAAGPDPRLAACATWTTAACSKSLCMIVCVYVCAASTPFLTSYSPGIRHDGSYDPTCVYGCVRALMCMCALHVDALCVHACL